MVMALLAIHIACRDQGLPLPAEQPAATVNGERIGLQEFSEKLAREAALVKSDEPLTAEQMTSLKEEVMGSLIQERLILQRAREMMLAVSDTDLEARIAEIKQDYGNENFAALFGSGGISYSVWRNALRKRILLEKVIALDVNAKITITDGEAEQYYKANRKRYA
jgi:hypothetical protein